MNEAATSHDPPHAEREVAKHDVAASTDNAHDAGPAPVQFRIKTLLALMAALSVAFAAMGRVSAVWAVVIGWTLLLVGAHVAANAMQTRATDHASSRRRRKPGAPPEIESFDLQRASAPTTRLGTQTRLGLGMAVIVGLGATVGCILGTTLIFFHNDGELTLPASLLAAASSTGIGAFLSFLAGTCANVVSKAFREATTSADPRR